jgi:hypothetical protein
MAAERGTHAATGKLLGDSGFQVPEALRERLGRWIDVDEVGPAGFWLWLESVLPILPLASEPGAGSSSSAAPPSIRVRQLARDLVDCARDRARLTITCERYFRDNQVLAVRLKAVEAALATTRSTGRPTDPGSDPESAEAAERYLPPR